MRFIQLYHRDWDHHGAVKQHVKGTAAEVDQGAAALIKDLKQRGMLDETLVIWGGEFGRTPMAQGDGRDHHIKGFSIWMAGGGIKGGITHGATDEFGYAAVQGRRPRPRPARHDPRPVRHRPPAAGLPLPGPRLPPDRRRRPGGETDPGVSVRSEEIDTMNSDQDSPRSKPGGLPGEPTMVEVSETVGSDGRTDDDLHLLVRGRPVGPIVHLRARQGETRLRLTDADGKG